MFENEKNNFKYIVKEKKMLLFGENNLKHFDNLFDMFHNVLVQEVTPFTLKNLNTTISQNSIDLIIINSSIEHEDIHKILIDIIEYEELCIILCKGINYNLSDDLINISSSVFTQNIQEEQLSYKLYMALNNRVLDLNKTNDDVKETYVDSFELEIIFIRDELLFISKKIDEGDISKNIVLRVSQSINRINRIFENYLIYSKSIKKSMKYFGYMLEKIDYQQATVENIDSFDFLSRIVEDIAVFLDNYFIKRSFTNLYVIEESLSNSLKFLKTSFENKKTHADGSSLEFFND